MTICPTLDFLRKDTTAFVALVIEGQGHSGCLRVFPPATFAHVFPQLLDLRLPGLEIHKEVVTGLLLVLAAAPAPVRRQLVHTAAQVAACRRTPGQEPCAVVQCSLTCGCSVVGASVLWLFVCSSVRLLDCSLVSACSVIRMPVCSLLCLFGHYGI